MFDVKTAVIYATLACVTVAVKTNTLELCGDAVYGQSFDLVCFTMVNAGVPHAAFLRGFSLLQVDTDVANIFYQPSSNVCNVLASSLKKYTYSCSNEGKNITLTVPAENEVEHNTFWKCTNQESLNEENNNVVHVFVNDPVRNITIRNTTVVIVIEGISEIFVCETSPCRPSAYIYWMKNGINITDPQFSSIILQSGTKNITSSSLQFTSVRGDNGSLLACGAYNGYGTRKLSAHVIIIVHYSPIVDPFTSPVKVIQGEPLVVVCSADGNPSPQLTWKPAGEDRVNKSRLYYSAISRDRAVIHTCNAINNMVPSTGNPQPGSDSKELLIDVLYYPTVNPFTSPIKVINGQALVVVCSAYGNPSPQLTWNPVGEDRVNTFRLYYSAISLDKAVIHTCNATNNMVPSIGNPQSGSDFKELLVDVLYPPIVNPFTLPVEVLEGQPLVVVCSADGNPSPQLTWNPAGEDKVNKSRLYYSSISRDKAVIHTCTASNNLVPTTGTPQPGSDFKELVIDVLYSASVYMFTSKDNMSLLNENSSLQLLCQVDSNPYAVISLYLGNDLKMKVENALTLSYMKTSTCLDAGKYTCSARNKIMNGDAVSRNIPINVTCYPRLDDRRNISTDYYGALGDNVTLEVYVIAYPVPTNIAWYHREKEADMWQLFPYQSPLSSGLYSSIMVHLDSEGDFGYYWVNMSNDFGIYNNTYRIRPEKQSTYESLGIPVAGVAGGISAGLVVILVVGIGIFLWRKYQHTKKNEHDKDIKMEHEERSPETDSYQ